MFLLDAAHACFERLTLFTISIGNCGSLSCIVDRLCFLCPMPCLFLCDDTSCFVCTLSLSISYDEWRGSNGLSALIRSSDSCVKCEYCSFGDDVRVNAKAQTVRSTRDSTRDWRFSLPCG